MRPSESPRRLGRLLGMQVVLDDGTESGHVNDVRLVRDGDAQGGLLIDGILVGSRHAGSMLGYDRFEEQGPWLVRTVVRWWHRDQQLVGWDRVESIDWEDRVVRIRRPAA